MACFCRVMAEIYTIGNARHVICDYVTVQSIDCSSIQVISMSMHNISDHLWMLNCLNISKVHGILSPSDNEQLVHAFFTSRLDYCNSVFAGLLYQQALLNTYNTKVSSSLYHSELILSLVLYLYLHATPTIYFSNLLNKNTPARSLRKSDGNLLVPKHS